MINTETVFIIGAGASKPYNFPTGRELRAKILKSAEAGLESYDTQTVNDLKPQIRSFIETFKNSGIYSIDKFLSFKPQFKRVGAMAIALIILRSEKGSGFDENVSEKYQGSDWYSWLYNRMLEGVGQDQEQNYLEFAQNKVSFITFNYDRSFDYYLYRCFSNTFDDQTFHKRETLDLIPFPIFHVYGAAILEWQKQQNLEGFADYQLEIDRDQIRISAINEMADSIKLMHELRTANEELTEIRKTIRRASRIFFLGFGFADENLKILGIPESVKDKAIFGTALGFKPREIKQTLHKLVPDTEKNKVKILDIKNGYQKRTTRLLNVDCLSLLREFL